MRDRLDLKRRRAAPAGLLLAVAIGLATIALSACKTPATLAPLL